MARKTDTKTLALIREINRKKSELAKLERPAWRTNCSFCPLEGSTNGATNLHVENDVKKLLKIAAYLIGTSERYYQAGTQLEVDNIPTFTWSGYTLEDWLYDIQTRVKKIQISSERQKLEALESRLNAIISPELRAELELQAIAEELE